MVLYKFVDIKIFDLRHLDTGWKEGIDILRKFIGFCKEKNGKLTLCDKNKWRLKMYGAKSNFTRVDRFIQNIMSVKKHGYLYYMDMSENDKRYVPSLQGNDVIWFKEIFSSPISGILPRAEWIENDNKWRLDDGRHRIAILLEMGVKKSPLTVIRTCHPATRYRSMASSRKFGRKLLRKLKEYSTSDEWLEYKKGDDYNNKASPWKWV